jgi:hypothetical protein
MLGYWDGDLLDSSLPDVTRRDDGVYEAFWVTWVDSYRYLISEKVDEYGDVEVEVSTETTGESDVIGYVEHVIFTRDTVEFAKYTDRLEWDRMSEPLTNERGEPYFTDWGEEYEYEAVTLDRREFVDVVLRMLNGGFKRVEIPHGQRDIYSRYAWREVPFTVQRKPATPEVWASYASTIGFEVVRNWGTGGDYASDLPLTNAEIRRLFQAKA